MGIFQRDAGWRLDPEPFGGSQKRIGTGFAAHIVATRDHDGKALEQTVQGKVALHVFVPRRCRDRAGQSRTVQEVEQFDNARLEAKL